MPKVRHVRRGKTALDLLRKPNGDFDPDAVEDALAALMREAGKTWVDERYSTAKVFASSPGRGERVY